MYIFCKRTSTTRKLAEMLSCRVLRDRRNKGRSVILPKRSTDLIINWGRVFEFPDQYVNVLNRRVIGNKLVEFKKLHEAGLTPEFWLNDTPAEQLMFPVLLRKQRHTQGNDIILAERAEDLIEKQYDFIVRYVKKKAEFRVHVCGGAVVLVTKKVRTREDADRVVWSYDRGYNHVTYDNSFSGKYRELVSNVAVKAIQVLGYDFGAVDIIINKDNKAFVLEVNSAPGLIVDNRIEAYIQYFNSKKEN